MEEHKNVFQALRYWVTGTLQSMVKVEITHTHTHTHNSHLVLYYWEKIAADICQGVWRSEGGGEGL